MDLTHEDRLMLEDFFRVQKILSGDDMLTILDQLYPYLKGAERGLDYQRFCSLAIKSVGMVKDEPKEDWRNSIGATMLNYLKRALGEKEFVPSTVVADGEPGGDERQTLSVMANNWLGETRDGMVGKLNAEQTCRMIAAVNVSLGPRSDAIYWFHILETSGLKEQGANVDQLERKYEHLATMCGVRTVSEYLKYHAEREPRCDTLTHQEVTDIILIPQTLQLVAPDMDSDYEVHFTDRVWGKVLYMEFNRVFRGVREGGLANKSPEDWKLLFNGLRVTPAKTGEQIMTEFYAHVLPCLRSPKRFNFEGLSCPVELRVPDKYTMMVIVGAFRNKNDAYVIDDVYETFNWLKRRGIVSFLRQNAYQYWGERFFEYLESCEIATFPGNKQKLAKLKASWGFQ